jgi:hypothetical protein
LTEYRTVSQHYLRKNIEYAPGYSTDTPAALCYPSSSSSSSMVSAINPAAHRMRPPEALASWPRSGGPASYGPASRSTMYATNSPDYHVSVYQSFWPAWLFSKGALCLLNSPLYYLPSHLRTGAGRYPIRTRTTTPRFSDSGCRFFFIAEFEDGSIIFFSFWTIVLFRGDVFSFFLTSGVIRGFVGILSALVFSCKLDILICRLLDVRPGILIDI